jgi:hypothetical protein
MGKKMDGQKKVGKKIGRQKIGGRWFKYPPGRWKNHFD